ncbi:unnamed protein product [Allacma fusca]|uniref:Uncharacterized protein n=1 Tax=Allacma fusca TaxID=39272 RepID=A0A8J2LBW9_9HEXA|nr:unnamed protein product [Allacma fusca]
MFNLTVPENDVCSEEGYMVKELLEDLEEKLMNTTSQVGEGGSYKNCAADGTGPGHYDEDTSRILMELSLMFKELGVCWQPSEEQAVPEGQATVNSEQSGSGTSSTMLDDNNINETHVEGPTTQCVEEYSVKEFNAMWFSRN